MSDSEFESIVVANNKAGGAKLKKTGQKRKSDASSFRSDSELEFGETVTKTKVKKPSQPKSSRTTTAVSKKKKETNNPFDVFELFPEDESIAKNYTASDQLGSSITQRVADGLTRRALNLEGEFFLELRVYNTADIRSESPEEKWKKALLSVKAQVDTDTPQWEYLQKLTKHLKTLFDDADVKFFNNKKA